MPESDADEEDAPLAWQDVTPAEAIALQKRLATRVRTANGFDPAALRTVAGIDVSVKRPWPPTDKTDAAPASGKAAVVILSYPQMEILDKATASAEITFPYIPGLLSFRETPLVMAALEKLSVAPDLLMVDGQGFAHPRRFGIACHLGVLTDKPALGVAKSILTGKYENLGEESGDSAPLIHRGETVGMAYRSKKRTNPLILSIGHKIDLPTAVSIVQTCLRGYRLPEPTRQAHQVAGEA